MLPSNYLSTPPLLPHRPQQRMSSGVCASEASSPAAAAAAAAVAVVAAAVVAAAVVATVDVLDGSAKCLCWCE